MEPAHSDAHSRPRLLLLHGAGLGRWIWDGVVPLVTDATAEPLDLPGRSPGENPDEVTLQRCVDFVRAQIGASPAQVILVGHSFSADVALAVAAAVPASIAGVVLIGGVFSASGKPFLSVLPLPQRLIVRFFLARARGGIKLPQSGVKCEYCNDLDERTTALVLSRVVPEAPRLYLDPVHWAALPVNVPRFYIKLTQDKSLSIKEQQRMIDRVGHAGVESLNTGHLPMLSDPAATAAVLNRIVLTLQRS